MRLKVRLLDLGQSEAIAAKVTQSFMAALHPHAAEAFKLDQHIEAESVAEIVALEITRGYNNVAPIALPKEPPERWRERLRKNSRETCIEFMRRVWGPYTDAGVLYQDDLRRLGEEGLMATIRSYCSHHQLNASEHLPPSSAARVDRQLANAVPGSRQEVFAKSCLRRREQYARIKL